jgi:hypothetical protein
VAETLQRQELLLPVFDLSLEKGLELDMATAA